MFSVKHHGGTRVLLQLANSLVERGHSVTILTPEDKYAPIYSVNKRIKIKFTSKIGNNKFFYLKTLLEFIFKIPKSDFILANFFPTLYPSFLAEKLGKGKTIYFPQGMEETSPNYKGLINLLLSSTEKSTFKIKAPIIATTKWGARKLLNFNRNIDLRIINLGLPDNTFFPDPDPKFINMKINKAILYFPRSQKVKGLEDFLQALDILIKKNIKFELWLISKETQSLSKFNHLKSSLKIGVLFPLNDQDLRRIYSSTDLLVNSSWVEGFCLPVLEAMACGTPSILTDSGGPREYAKNNYNCLMVPPKKPDLLAQAIKKMLEDEELRNKLAVNALKTGEKFKFSKFVEEFEKFLINLK